MMLRIALQGIRDYYRDGSALFFGLIFPIVMVACLGNMLAGLDDPDAKIETIKAGYYANEDAKQAADTFVNALKEIDSMELTPEKSESAAGRSVETKKTDVAFIFADGPAIKVYEGGDSIKNRAALMTAKSFVRESAAYTAAFTTLGKTAPHNIAQLTEKLSAPAGGQSGLIADKKHDGRTQTMMDFYAVTMVIMICFMGSGIGGASGMYLLRREKILDRLSVSPRRGETIYLGNVLGCVPGSLMQTAAVMLPSVLFLGARYASTPADNLLLFAFFTLLGTTVSAAFMLLGLIMKINPYLPVMAVLWTMLFISGSFSKEISIPGVTEYMPMNIMNRAAFDLTLFGRPGQILTVMAVLAVILAASCAAGSLFIKRKGATA
jgi:ABC-2 type transport system permease protein